MEVVADKKVKRELWEEWSDFLCNHLSSMDDPEFAVIKFVAKEATIYVGGSFDTVEV